MLPVVENEDGIRDPIWELYFLSPQFFFRERFPGQVDGDLQRTPGACRGFSLAPCLTAARGGTVWQEIEDTVAAVVRSPDGSSYSGIVNRLVDTVCSGAPVDFPSVCRARPNVALFFRSANPAVIDFRNRDSGFDAPTVTGTGGTATVYIDVLSRAGVDGTIRADDVSVPRPFTPGGDVTITLSSTAASVAEGGSVVLTAAASKAVPADTVVTLARGRG